MKKLATTLLVSVLACISYTAFADSGAPWIACNGQYVNYNGSSKKGPLTVNKTGYVYLTPLGQPQTMVAAIELTKVDGNYNLTASQYSSNGVTCTAGQRQDFLKLSSRTSPELDFNCTVGGLGPVGNYTLVCGD